MLPLIFSMISVSSSLSFPLPQQSQYSDFLGYGVVFIIFCKHEGLWERTWERLDFFYIFFYQFINLRLLS